MENRQNTTWKRINKKLKRILKRREIERLKKLNPPKLAEEQR